MNDRVRHTDKIIYLDLDGVLVDWNSAAYALFDREPPARHAPQQWNIENDIGVTEDELWERIDAQGPQWWANLPAYPWANALYDGLLSVAPVFILTAPCKIGHSAMGKVQWMRRFFGDHFRDYIITSQKHLCARPGAVLVDDRPRNCERFVEAGGETVTFPQPWNGGGHVGPERVVNCTVNMVRSTLGG